jgi:hypothetical protein
MMKITSQDIDDYAAGDDINRQNVCELLALEAFARRAAQVEQPFMLKGSLITRQYLGPQELELAERRVADMDWVYLIKVKTDNVIPLRAVLDNWVQAITEVDIDDGIRFRNFSENQFWRMIDYAMDDDFPTVNTDLLLWIGDEEFEISLDVSLNLNIDLPPVPLLYQPVMGEAFNLPYTVPLALQIAWKLHQTIIRPRFKDLLDLTRLLKNNTIDTAAVWQALQAESQHDKADMSRLKLLLDIDDVKAPGLSRHPVFINKVKNYRKEWVTPSSLDEAWKYWRYPGSRNCTVITGAESTVYYVDNLPAEVGVFLKELADELQHSGLALLIMATEASPTNRPWWKIW